MRINSVSDASISCKNLVNFCWVTPDITEFAYLDTCIWRKLTYTSAFRNAVEHWNADGRVNSVNDLATPGINLVGF